MFDFNNFIKSQITLSTKEITKDIEEKALEFFDIGNKKNIINEYLKFNKLTQQHIDVYNNFIKKAVNIISSKVIDLEDGRKVYFENLKFEKPMYQYENTRRKLFPMHARRTFKSYDSEWTVDVVIKENNNVVYKSPEPMCIARIPVMLFSMLCHLEDMTDEQLIEVGEDPLEYGGYFIVLGTEIVILLEEKLSTNRMFIMNSAGDVKDYNTTLKITTNTLKGTRLDELIYNTSNILKYSIQSLKKDQNDKKKSNYKRTKKINIIYIFQLFSEFYLNYEMCYTIDDITALIKQYVVNPKSMDALLETIAATRSKNQAFTAKEVLNNKIKGNRSIEVQTEDIMGILKNIFEHLEDLSPLDGELQKDYTTRIVKLKVILLAIMAANYLDYIMGFRELDDRDHWANKRVEGPGRKMEQLLRNSWNKIISDTNKLLDKNASNEEIFKNLGGGVICKTISKYFNDSIKNSKWGITKGKLQNNATQVLNRDNMLATLSHINTINVNIQRTDKNKKIRMIPPNQLRKVGYIKSPEGDNCPEISTPVFLANGGEIAIGNLKDGDEVLTIDPITFQQSPSIIKNHFIKSTEEYGKPVVKIISMNGKEIVCTDDHPFLTQLGWVHAKDLDINTHKMVMYPGVKPLSYVTDKTEIILDYDIFQNNLKILGIKQSLINKHIEELEDKNLLPLRNNDINLSIIARICGFMLTDGSLGIYNSNPHSSFCFGTKYDGQLFQKDMENLGFPPNKLSYTEGTITDKITGRVAVHHAWTTNYYGCFATLLLSLGMMYGKRVEKANNPVPDWVMNGSPLVKREFLAGFQGGDGSKMQWFKRAKKVKAGKFNFPWTIKHKCPEHIDSLMFFMNQLMTLFKEFGIEFQGLKQIVESETRHIAQLNFSDKEENILRYMEMIGYRYSTTKSTDSYHISEYIRYKHNKIQERIKLKNTISELTEQGLKPGAIAKQLDIRTRLVTSIQEGLEGANNTERKSNHDSTKGSTLSPKDTMGFEEWLSCTSAINNCVLMPIQKIEPHPHCMVADFTTESDNHSFIANSYCVHNCGLVKPLAITTRISLDRGIEGDRIILKYINYTDVETVQNKHIFILNGKYIGWVDGTVIRDTLINARRNGNIYYDTSFFINSKYLYADSSPSRLISPVLIVDSSTQRLVMDIKNITDISPMNLIKEGAMEYISGWEELNCKIATDYKLLHEKTVEIKKSKLNYEHAKKLYKNNKKNKTYKQDYSTKRTNYRDLLKSKLYTHCDMSGRTGFGVAADTIPFINHNQGPRNVYQAGMITQAISIPHLNYRNRFDNLIKILESPTSPIVKTDMYDVLGLTDRGIGQNVIIGIASADNTEEDAIIFNQGAIDRGLFRIVKYFTVQGQIKISDPIIKSYYGNPSKHGIPYDKKFKNLNEDGLPIIGSYLDEQDCVIGIIKEKNGITHDDSIYLNYGEKGIVDDIMYHETDTHEIITVKIRTTRIPANGDKYAARFSQKGTIRIVPESEMPFSERTGMIPDGLINVTVIPSRMTVSYLYEIITGKAAALSGETVDATAFEDIDMDKWNTILVNHGYTKEGTEKMRDGKTGHSIETSIYMGNAYMQALKHQPQDKIGVRSQGTICAATHAATKGRAKAGGLRFGEMEKDTLLGHGASATTKERLCDVSDKYNMAVCKCGEIAIYNMIRQEFYCPLCPSKEIGNVTIPYVLKYNKHLQGAAGINMNLGVENNIIHTVKNIPTIEEEDLSEDEIKEDDNEDDDDYDNEDDDQDVEDVDNDQDVDDVDDVEDDIDEDYY